MRPRKNNKTSQRKRAGNFRDNRAENVLRTKKQPLLKWGIIAVVAVALLGVGGYAYVALTSPDTGSVARFIEQLKQSDVEDMETAQPEEQPKDSGITEAGERAQEPQLSVKLFNVLREELEK